MWSASRVCTGSTNVYNVYQTADIIHDVADHCYTDNPQVRVESLLKIIQCNTCNTHASTRDTTLKFERCIVSIREWMKNKALKTKTKI